ncbi:Helix-turn-helix domain-containing protein [Pseudomonas sp. ok272]|uniref:AraC family transcriptional regulator n=1 Tax=unclassified Pseudomonas TaxID=196821 RepID=UPI0008BADC1D|nr:MULTISPECIES: AraC family transcriptional regulator [unclassified Pseudomonas]SEN59106.1 Helix-turn-helix domain-containing protein [Pseudomonas sp. ok272]SFN37327.1 Helix-turn-helix domain-containing protein [Pseudomonas sp. ok602]
MPDQTFASSAFTRTILSHARQVGLCEEQLLQRAGIRQSWLDDQHQHIPARLVEQLWRECENAGVGRNFGCELVNGMATSCLQGMNILLDSAATLRVSLRCFTDYLPRVTNHVLAELEEQDNEARLHLRPVASGLPHFFALDAATLSLVRNISRRVGKAPAELFRRVDLALGQAAGDWLKGQGIDVEGGDHPCLVLPRAMLDLPLLSANPFLHQSMLRHWHVAAPHETRSDSLDLARHWLTAGDQPIERIAERLGYRQPSNFIRAFRKQFGITPKQFRLSHFQACNDHA